MAITYVDIEDRYFVQPSDTDDIIISVIIGDGQTGGYLIFLDNQFKAANKNANLKTAHKLLDKRCLIVATVVDMLNQTNWTSVTVQIQNGNNSKVYGPYSKEAAAHLDTISYSISIQFQAP
jgi:hypothetical protein